MLDRARIVTVLLGVGAAAAAAACGSIIGIEDGVLSPELNGGADTGTDSTPQKDSSTADSSPAVDAAPPRGPLGAPGGDKDDVPCNEGKDCAISDGNTCCAYRTTGTTQFTAACIPNGTTCEPSGSGTDRLIAIKCMGPQNCDGDRCCYNETSPTTFETSCKSSCSSGEESLCVPSSSNNTCQNFRVCRPFNTALPSSWGHWDNCF